jgi:hypothetical protein
MCWLMVGFAPKGLCKPKENGWLKIWKQWVEIV